jgi:hypothetical protein
MRTADVTQLMACPACGAAMTVRAPMAPGRSWLAVMPCKQCRSYAAYMVTDEGAARAWVLRRSLADGNS